LIKRILAVAGAATRFLHRHHTNLVLHVGLIAPFVGSWMQALRARPLRSRRMRCIHLLRRRGLCQKAAIGAVTRWRKQMLLYWTIAELMHLTRNELCDLAEQIALKLPEFEAGTVARHGALTSLDNIRKVLRLRDLRL
jgi:hypothetical protein